MTPIGRALHRPSVKGCTAASVADGVLRHVNNGYCTLLGPKQTRHGPRGRHVAVTIEPSVFLPQR
ncbi:MAG TPA: hypothetical protein VIK18_02910, partial [Pirellulales bacterium]